MNAPTDPSVDPASLPLRVGDVANAPDFASWRAINVDALVMGQVERGAAIQSSVRVWVDTGDVSVMP